MKKWVCSICNEPVNKGYTRCWECYNKSKRIEVKCAYCNNLIMHIASRLKYQKNFFCNEECRNEWKKENRKKNVYICPVCNKEFKRYKSQVQIDQPCCSLRCSSYLNSKKGNASIFYIDGRTPLRVQIKNSFKYHEWRTAIFDRDHYRCVDCNSNKNIHAHHVITFSQLLDRFMIRTKKNRHQKALKDKSLWNIDNGITLCEKCHTARHPNVNLMNKEKIIE